MKILKYSVIFFFIIFCSLFANAEEIKIVAIDKWNNRAEKTVKVTIDLQSTDVARVYENLNPNNVRAKTDKNKIAIIIGIEKYEKLGVRLSLSGDEIERIKERLNK